jgi:uncharacterized membrane protein HdeD (DUF308 family)
MNSPIEQVSVVCVIPDTRSKWSSFVTFGISLLALTAIATLKLPDAKAAPLHGAGLLMIAAAVAIIAQTFHVRTWGGSAAWLLSGIVYGLAGLIAFTSGAPAGNAGLLLALMLITSGLMRLWWSVALTFPRGLGWITTSGATSVLAGFVFIGWPDVAAVPAIIVAFDLAVQGATAIAFGYALRS